MQLYQSDMCHLAKLNPVPFVVIFYQNLRYSRLCLTHFEMNLISMRKMTWKMYESGNPSLFENDEISTKLIFLVYQKEKSYIGVI